MALKQLSSSQNEAHELYKEISAPATPATGYVAVYAKSDGKIYRKDDAGTEAELGGSAAVSDGDKGDITVSGSGATWTVDNDAITFAKMQNISTDRLLGRDTALSGDVEEISLQGTLEFTASSSIQRAALTGDVTASAGSNTTTLDKSAITGKTAVTPATDDYIIISDTSDSGNLKKSLISDLPSSGGGDASLGIVYAISKGYAMP